MTKLDTVDQTGGGEEIAATAAMAHGLPLFILSRNDRDNLSSLALASGWRPVAARRSTSVEQRFLSSQAQIALVDARNGVDKVLPIIAAISESVEAIGGALLALVDAADAGRLQDVLAAGATHYLADDVTDERIAIALAFAQRHVERLGGGSSESYSRKSIQRSDALSWRYMVGEPNVSLSAALAEHLGAGTDEIAPLALLRRLGGRERKVLLNLCRQVGRGGAGAAFAHMLPGKAARRVAHHLYNNGDGISGEIEILPNGEMLSPEAKDNLTGLSNRGAAQQWIDRTLGQGKAVLILLAISQFDRINAAYGRMAGNALLGRIGRRIERLVEEEHGSGVMLARMAGTQFLIGLPAEEGTGRATFLAQRLMATVARPFSAGDHLIRLTARCGIAAMLPGDDSGRFLRRASAALAEAKLSENQTVRVRVRDGGSRAVDDDQLETDLRLAIGRGEIEILFQPQYEMGSDALMGVEALARWNHPRFGSLGGQVLFAAAERSDYLLPLSAHIQKRALEMAAAWPATLSHLRLSINVTAADIAQPDFFETFMRRLSASGFPLDRLTVEITESGLIEDLGAASTLLGRWREAGVRVAIDDFGTGYSSLAYLKSLPLDYLKIDSGLAKDIAASERDSIIVGGVIGMAKSLGLRVVAEGVESEEQLMLLARKGCDFYQGFLRSGAVGSEQLAALLEQVIASPRFHGPPDREPPPA